MLGDFAMRQLTLKGFIASYVKELSFSNTSSITKLINELDENPRLKEPLILHGILSGMPSHVSEKAPSFYSEYLKIKDVIGNHLITEQYDTLPENYKKILNTYNYKKNRINNDNHTKSLMRNKIIQIKNDKSISNYRIYTQLGMNHGNVNYFLKNGNLSKLSLNDVRAILDYVKNYSR
jgi:uncharacterized protein YutD